MSRRRLLFGASNALQDVPHGVQRWMEVADSKPREATVGTDDGGLETSDDIVQMLNTPRRHDRCATICFPCRARERTNDAMPNDAGPDGANSRTTQCRTTQGRTARTAERRNAEQRRAGRRERPNDAMPNDARPNNAGPNDARPNDAGPDGADGADGAAQSQEAAYAEPGPSVEPLR